jgi:maleylpyruvate isomerase
MMDNEPMSFATIPNAWLDGCTHSHRRVEALVSGLTDEQARRGCLLPGWTVGHLLTHIARNADGNSHMFEAALKGEVQPQYPGGQAQRDGDIEAGSGRPAAELIRDLSAANQRMEQAWAAVSERVWATGVGISGAGPAAAPQLVFKRWREVEVHICDIGLPELGPSTWEELSPTYLEVEWPEMVATLPRRLPKDVTVVLAPGDRLSRAAGQGHSIFTIEAPATQVLQWMMGRGGDPSWPVLAPW